MESPDQTLDRLSRRRGAVFAMDAANRIIHWNRACEELFGMPAHAVMGKPCYEVIDGRDASDNHYCQRSCPVARQAREPAENAICPFELSVKTGNGGRKTISTTLFAIDSYHPALATLVHVCQEAAPKGAKAESPRLDPPPPAEGAETLTSRETEVLRALSLGLPNTAIAETLFISSVTVRNHVARILNKLHVHSKLEAVVFAFRNHLI